ncbi:GrpB family protein [Achromobacter xylosoxidans]|nr:GrpB family protein [Achromobacter xylosoxidans]MCZ8440393.1 GrpB family protein [Achromobacter xylosoxidans]
MRHYDSDPDEDPWVRGKPAPEAVVVVPYDPDWPARYARLAQDIAAALGPAALRIDHVGSTTSDRPRCRACRPSRWWTSTWRWPTRPTRPPMCRRWRPSAMCW